MKILKLTLLLLLPFMAQSQKEFKVVAYCTHGTDVSSIPFQYITHLNYSFAIPAKLGDTLNPIRDKDYVNKLVKTAHEKGKKVFLSIGGWAIGDGMGDDTRFHKMSETAQGRKDFIESTMKTVTAFDFDGVDLDWEYPDPDHRSAEDYVLLCKDLYNQLHKQGKQLTAAVVSAGKQAYGIKEEVYPYLDWLNLMIYDGDYGPEEIRHHSPYSMALECVDFWLNARHLPAGKAVLGLPFYAKKGHGNYGFTYKQLLKEGASSFDDYWNGHYYNGIFTIKNKTKLALEKKLAGVMVWEISCDASGENSLFKAINECLKLPFSK